MTHTIAETPTRSPFAGGRRARALRLIAAASAALLMLSLPGSALAEKYTAARKAGRGLAAMTTCFLEIPGNIVKESRENGYARGFTLGFAMGLGKVIPRVLVGAYEFLSAPFPAPKGFKPLLDPEFPWNYFDEQR